MFAAAVFAAQGTRAASVESTPYDLGRAAVVETVLKFVAESYIDPGRFDPERAFENTMKDLEAFVPEFRCDFVKGATRYRIQMNTQAKEVDQVRLVTFDDYYKHSRGVLAFVQKTLKSDIPMAKIEYETVNGFLETLDPHSRLMDPDSYEEFVVATQGEFGGLGIQIQMRDSQLTVISPVDDTPAFKAGIRPGDRITKIEDESTDNMTLDDAVKRLRGPANTQVKITILRGKLDPFDLTLTRDRIKLKAVESAMLDDGVGYVKIKSFQENTAIDMERALDTLQKQLGDRPLKGAVMDLRNNPGGLLDEATALANRFIKQGVIVTTVDGRHTKSTRAKTGLAKKYGDLPLVVLVNEGSASASEIIAGAIRNQNRGLVMGQRTFGKGSVQNVFPLSDRSALKLTVQQYLTPGDVSIQNVGVTPNIQLNPIVVAPEEVRLRAHQRPYREVDLDNHLAQPGSQEKAPAPADLPSIETEYLLEPGQLKDEDEVTDEDPSKPYSSTERMKADLAKDFPVQLARQMISEGGSPNGPQFLESARGTIRKTSKTQAALIDKALTKSGLDWSLGPTVRSGISLDVALTVQDEKGATMPAAVSGRKNYLNLRVTNRSQSMLYRLHAYTTAENGFLNNQEFLFGRLAPGATAEKKIPVTLGHGLSSWSEFVNVVFEAGESEKIFETGLPVSIAKAPAPRFELVYSLTDSTQTNPLARGDGDGLIEPGETIVLSAKLKNTGKGDSERAFVQFRSKSGQLVEVGQSGSRYTVKNLKAGASDSIAVPVRISKDFVEPKIVIPLRVSDANFPVELSSDIEMPVSIGPAAGARDGAVTGKQISLSAPVIQIEQQVNAGTTVNERSFKVSGEVIDDSTVRDVFIMVNGRKSFYYSFEQAGQMKLDKYPFNVKIPIKPGLNRMLIVARDTANLSSVQSFTVWQTDGPVPPATPTAQRETPSRRTP